MEKQQTQKMEGMSPEQSLSMSPKEKAYIIPEDELIKRSVCQNEVILEIVDIRKFKVNDQVEEKEFDSSKYTSKQRLLVLTNFRLLLYNKDYVLKNLKLQNIDELMKDIQVFRNLYSSVSALSVWVLRRANLKVEHDNILQICFVEGGLQRKFIQFNDATQLQKFERVIELAITSLQNDL